MLTSNVSFNIYICYMCYQGQIYRSTRNLHNIYLCIDDRVSVGGIHLDL